MKYKVAPCCRNNSGLLHTVLAMYTQRNWLLALCLPGNDTSTPVTMVAGPLPISFLGLDVPKGRAWTNKEGRNWLFGVTALDVCLLHPMPFLSTSQLTNVKPYPLPLGARKERTPVLEELKEQRIIVSTHSHYNSLVWPVRKMNQKWGLPVDYWRFNAISGPLIATVQNIAELTASIQEQDCPMMATPDVQDTFFYGPLTTSV